MYIYIYIYNYIYIYIYITIYTFRSNYTYLQNNTCIHVYTMFEGGKQEVIGFDVSLPLTIILM